MKVVESAAGLTYSDAKAKCSELDPIAYPAAPYNQYLQSELIKVVSSSNLPEASFWLGKSILQSESCMRM